MGAEPERTRPVQPNHAGLCANCKHARSIESDRGSTFYLCRLSATHPKLPKYPRLPVLACDGYDERGRMSG